VTGIEFNKRARLLTVLVLPALLVGRPAAAPPTAQRPRQALAACAAGDVNRGVAILADLFADTRDPGYVFNQGRCYQQNGQLEQAQQRFREYLRLGTAEPPADLARARGFLAEIDATLARRAAEARAKETSTAAARADALEGRRSALRKTALVLGGLAVVGLGAGAVMSYEVQAQEKAVEKRFGMDAVVTDGAGLRRQLSDGGRYETWQWIGYGVGVAAAAGALTAFGIAELGARSPTGDRAVVRVAPLAGNDVRGGLVVVTY
jgi:hypothetical protein